MALPLTTIRVRIAPAIVTSKRTQKKADPASTRVVDLSQEDITNLDDSLVADLLSEALAEATESSAKPPEPSEPGSEEGEEIDFGEALPEEDLDPDLEPSPGDDDGESGDDEESDDGPVGSAQLLPGGAMMLSDEDADLAFPDDLHDDESEEELSEHVADLEDELEHLRRRVDELSRGERNAVIRERRLKDEAATLDSQLEVYKDRLLELKEKNDSFRSRMARERDDGVRRGTERVIKAFLPVVDNMELALGHANKSDNGAGLREGFALILDQLLKTLSDLDVSAIEVEPGTPFDPALHDAIAREPADGHPANSVKRGLRTGYVAGDRLLRAARVAVATAEEPEEPEEPEEAEEPDEPGEPDEDVGDEEPGVDDPPQDDSGDDEASDDLEPGEPAEDPNED